MGTLLLKKLSTGLAFALTIALGSSTSAVHGSTYFSYTATELGTLPGYTQSYVQGINDLGQAVGDSFNVNGPSHAFLWDKGKLTDLGTLGGKSSFALKINNQGQVVGYSQTSNGSAHAFLWANGMMKDLDTFGSKRSVAQGINNRGQVVGSFQTSNGSDHAFVWNNGKMTDLGTLGGKTSYALGINDKGQVVGYSQTSSGSDQAFLWENGLMKGLSDLGYGNSVAYGINNKGQIVGSSEAQKYNSIHCVLWSEGTLQDITPRFKDARGFGLLSCHAPSINNKGALVGYVSADGVDVHPFVWRNSAGILLDKKVLGVNSGLYFSSVEGINNNGQIVVNGLSNEAYLLTPTWVIH